MQFISIIKKDITVYYKRIQINLDETIKPSYFKNIF